MAFIKIESGPDVGQQHTLSSDRIVLGRNPDCTIILTVGAISRQHAAISRDGNDWHLEDLKSRNGTFLNDAPCVAKTKLANGDRIKICDVVFVFQGDARPNSQPATAAFEATPEGSVFGAMFVDDPKEGPSSTIMSRFDAHSRKANAAWTTSPEVRLTALVEIMTNLGNAIKLDDVLPKILTSLFKIFIQADRGFIGLKNAEGRLIPRWTKVRREGQEDTIRISRTITNAVMDSKSAILSADAASDQRFEMSQSIADFRIRSMMCAPLLDNAGESIGVLQIDTLDQRKRFQNDDLELLVSAANQAAIAIQNAQLHERALRQVEVERDMQLARDVQRGFLPDRRPVVEGYDFFDFYQPADQVGGDYFDYITLPDGRLATIVADVVGHGVAAAMLMAKLSAEARHCLFAESEPAKAVTLLNERLCALNIGRFITFVAAVLDPRDHSMTMVNAGHMSPIIRRRTGAMEEPAEEIGGLPLGISDALPYDQTRVTIEPGDFVSIYTDGVNECINAAGDFYTIERLRERIAKHPSNESAVVGQTVVDDVLGFLGKAQQPDDMCFVCFRRQ